MSKKYVTKHMGEYRPYCEILSLALSRLFGYVGNPAT